MESVILQTAPKPDPCAGILDGICVLQETVESFLNARQFRNAQLADLLPCGFEFIIGNAETSIPAEKALPEITMKRSDLALKPINPNNLANFGSAVAQPAFSIEFEIKTAYFKLSEMLTLELGQFLLVIAPYIRQFNLNLAGVICGAVHRNRECAHRKPGRRAAQLRVSGKISNDGQLIHFCCLLAIKLFYIL